MAVGRCPGVALGYDGFAFQASIPSVLNSSIATQIAFRNLQLATNLTPDTSHLTR
jgi:hypothetical protein